MRVIASKNTNKIYDLASKLTDSMLPFFFVKKNQESLLPLDLNFTLKINRQMTPFLKNLPQKARLGFWSLPQNEIHSISPVTFRDSIVLNPFKTQKLIATSLMKGIKKMMVSDIQQIVKIQNCYFRLIKEGKKIEQPEYIWTIENKNQDLENVQNLLKCDIPIHGYYFTRQMKVKQISSFLKSMQCVDPSIPKFRQIELQGLKQEKDMLQKEKIQPIITNYSEIKDYIMVCRIIGKEKTGKPIFQNKCLDFICRGEVCSCSNPIPKILDTFKTDDQEWAIVNPLRLDKLDPNYIIANE